MDLPIATIQSAFQILLKKFAKLELLASTIKSSSLQQYKVLQKNETRLQELGMDDFKVSAHSMSFRDMQTNAPVFYDFKERDTKELVEDLISSKNKQFQWILVEAFEAFEDFINECCLALGEQFKPNEKLSVRLNAIRNHLPSFGISELRNAREMNYRSAIALAEMLRHVIVHNGGLIKDETKFLKKLNSVVQKNNAGQHDPDVESTAKFFMYKWRHDIEIYLLEEQEEKSRIKYIDRLNTLLGWLLTYSSCIKDHAIRKLHSD